MACVLSYFLVMVFPDQMFIVPFSSDLCSSFMHNGKGFSFCFYLASPDYVPCLYCAHKSFIIYKECRLQSTGMVVLASLAYLADVSLVQTQKWHACKEIPQSKNSIAKYDTQFQYYQKKHDYSPTCSKDGSHIINSLQFKFKLNEERGKMENAMATGRKIMRVIRWTRGII